MNLVTLPLVSVVIPTYNSVKFIAQAIDSVLNQTYTNYEIVIVDDGSTDETKKLLKSYQGKINYVYQENQGVATARNRGIEIATGELIAFLDADDLFLPNKLEQQVKVLLEQPSLGMVVCGWRITDEAGEAIGDVKLWERLPKLDLETWLYWKPVLPSATIVRREWLLEVGGFPQATIPVEDVECFLELVAQGCEAAWCPQVGTVYRQINPDSLCRHTLRRVQSLELLHQRFFAKADLPAQIRQLENSVVYANLVWSAWHLYQNGYEQEMSDYLRQSLSFTRQSAAEISLNWVESFESYHDVGQPQLNTYRLTQTPGWQALIADTLAVKKPQVSVVIPAYNSARYISDAIASVLEQTYTDYEIIVINDGSTDNTDEMVTPYLDCVRYFKQENQGVSAARNRGIYLARGELVAFLDADDILMPHKLEQQVEIFTTLPEIGIVNSGFRLITEAGEEVSDTERWHKIPELTPEVWLIHKPVLPSAMMFRRHWLVKVEGFDTRFFASEDVELVLRLAAQGCKSTWLKEITVYYRQHDRSATRGNPIKQAANAEFMQDCFFARTDIPESMRRLEAQSRYDFLVWIACVLYQKDCIDEAIAYLRKSLKHTPYNWSETIAQWVNSFRNSGELNACPFNAYAFSKLPQWQELTLSMRIANIFNVHSQQATTYQIVTTQQPEASEMPLYAAAYADLGTKLSLENDLEQAVIWLNKAIALDSDNYWYYEKLGDAALKKYDLDTAIINYRLAIRFQPDNQIFSDKLNRALELQQRWRELTDYCQELIVNPPEDEKLKMLMVFPYPPYPPETGGAAMRMFEQIKYFGSRHHLTVAAFIFDESDYQSKDRLEEYCDRAFVFKLGTPITPDRGNINRQLYNFKTWNMTKALQQLSQVDFDVVSFDFIVGAVYRDLFAHCFTVLNEHNIESKLLSRCAKADRDYSVASLIAESEAAKPFADAPQQAQLLQQYEDRNWHKFSLRTVVSQADKQELEHRCHQGKTIVVKNGIDAANLSPVANFDSNKILYMGNMSYYPNIDGVLYFFTSILPQIWQQNPDLRFCIAGRQPPQAIRELALKNTRVEVITNPKNMSIIAQQCCCSLVPLRLGSGTRIKILHSMAMGLPVITTSLGCEGLMVSDRQNLLIQDRDTDFAEAVVGLKRDRQLWDKLQLNGRQLVESEYNWTTIFAEYEQQLIAECVNKIKSVNVGLENY